VAGNVILKAVSIVLFALYDFYTQILTVRFRILPKKENLCVIWLLFVMKLKFGSQNFSSHEIDAFERVLELSL
jgi:hypothetical protein